MRNKKGDKTFVTLGDTFQPSTAAQTVDPRTAALENAEQRKWDTVWAEAKLVPQEQVDIDDALIATATPQEVGLDEDAAVTTNSTITMTTTTTTTSSYHRCNFLVLLIGWSTTIAAMGVAFGMELGGAVVYCVAAVLYRFAQAMRHLGGCFHLLAGLFLFLSYILLMIDFVLLTVGILLSEILACVACFLCILFGGCSAGTSWQQHIRKVTHLARWAFRGFHEGWKPERKIPCLGKGQQVEVQEDFEAQEVSPPSHSDIASEEKKKGTQQDAPVVVPPSDVTILD